MQIIVNGKSAAIKSGSSFEFHSENRLFSGSDGYTLTITFPLRDCPQNLAIFGNIHRPDVDISRLVYDCEIRHRNFTRAGTLTITGVSDIEVKAQFLEGRSAQNFAQDFSTVYINELDLGEPYFQDAADIPPADAWDAADRDWESVALPWVNNSSSGAPHNFAEYSDGEYSWSEDTVHLTWQPYLLYITRKICEALGYTYDFSAWESDLRFSRLIICNTLPEAWDLPGYASPLPHWTVEEYFGKLELFLAGEFNIDHRKKDITFGFSRQILEAADPVKIDSVVDEYSVEIKVDDPQCDYSEARNLQYKDPGHDLWKYQSCPWYISYLSRNIIEYPTISAMLDDTRRHMTWDGLNHRGDRLHKLFHVADVDMYYIIRTVSRVKTGTDPFGNVYTYTCQMQPVNIFGGRIIGDDADTDEIEFIPARIDWTEDRYGYAIFLDIGSYTGSGSVAGDPDHDAFRYTGAQSALEAGEKSDQAEYFSTIYVAYWNGMEDFGGKLPHPHVENIEIMPDWTTVRTYPFSLRLNDTVDDPRPVNHRIDTHHKSVFKFLSPDIPDVRAVFHIRGKRYICEKITATFTESGMSQLLKGEFYPLLG